MLDLVAEAARGQLFVLNFKLRAVTVLRAHAHDHRARDDAVLARYAQAALKARLLALGLDDLWVDELDDLALLILHDADAAQDADLRGGEADATGLLQCVRHVVEQLMQPVVEFRHGAADLCKAGVAHFVDLANSHNFILFSLL